LAKIAETNSCEFVQASLMSPATAGYPRAGQSGRTVASLLIRRGTQSVQRAGYVRDRNREAGEASKPATGGLDEELALSMSAGEMGGTRRRVRWCQRAE